MKTTTETITAEQCYKLADEAAYVGDFAMSAIAKRAGDALNNVRYEDDARAGLATALSEHGDVPACVEAIQAAEAHS